MMRLRRRRGTFVIILLIASAIFLISLQFSGRYKGDFLYSLVTKIISPCQGTLHWAITSVGNLFQNYVLLVDLKEQNLRLQDQLRRLQKENEQLREYAQAVKRLRRLLLFKRQVPAVMIPAEVIAYSPSAWFRTIVINKGLRDGVRKGMPAVTWEGVVGRVIKVSSGSSTILLIIDRNSSVDALVQRTRTRGVLEGEGGPRCQLKYVPRTDEIRIGDRIVTSG
ncbi:MAG: rod shape-determining protein MreC, partial [Deltaproteobacteria bacterium]